MNTYLAEIIAEARLEKGADRLGQRLAASPQCVEVSFQVRGDFWCLAWDRLGLEGFLLLFLNLSLNQWSNLSGKRLGLN